MSLEERVARELAALERLAADRTLEVQHAAQPTAETRVAMASVREQLRLYLSTSAVETLRKYLRPPTVVQ